MEMALSMVVFIILISAAASYYKVMRTSIIRQEVVRNLIFAKINNSGSLTSIPSDSSGSRLYLGGIGSPFTVEAGNPVEISQVNSCFMVVPGGDANLKVKTPYEDSSSGSSGGASQTGEVNILTYAVIYRNNGASCVN